MRDPAINHNPEYALPLGGNGFGSQGGGGLAAQVDTRMSQLFGEEPLASATDPSPGGRNTEPLPWEPGAPPCPAADSPATSQGPPTTLDCEPQPVARPDARAAYQASYHGQGESNRQRPRRFGRWLTGVVATAIISGVAAEVAATSTVGGSTSVQQAAALPPLGYQKEGDTGVPEAVTIQERLREARALLSAYQPLVEQAATDPRTGDMQAIPGHQEVSILMLALLFRGNPDNPRGPIPIPPKAFRTIEMTMKAEPATTEGGSGLAPLRDEQDIPTNLRAAIFQMRWLYQQWSHDNANTGQPISDFVAYYFGSGRTGQIAQQIYQEWRDPTNQAYQNVLASSRYANHLGSAVQALVGTGKLSAGNHS